MMDLQNELQQLPVGWAYVRLAEIVDRVEKIDPRDDPNRMFVYLDIASIDNEKLKITEPKRYLGKDAPSRARQVVRTGDILFSTVRTYLKNIAVVPSDFDEQLASTGFCVIRPVDEINKKLIFYLTQFEGFLNPLNKIQRGTSYPAVRDSDVLDQVIPIPPLTEQHRIVAKIEQLFSDLDAGVAALENAKKQLKRYRQSVLQSAVTGKLTADWRAAHQHELEPASVLLDRIRAERAAKQNDKQKELLPLDTSELAELPDSWVAVVFDDVLTELKNGFFYGRASTEPPGIPILRINAVRPLSVQYDDLRYVPVARDDVAQYELRDGDLLFTRYNGNLHFVGACGQVRRLNHFVIYPDKLIRGRVLADFVLPDFLELYFASAPARNIIERKAKTTAGQQGISGGDLKSVPLKVPPVAEQKQIIAEVERRLSVADQIEKTIDASLLQSERLRQSILKRAFAGKLVPQDPTDEPAEKLLERIRANREKQPNGKTKQLPLLNDTPKKKRRNTT